MVAVVGHYLVSVVAGRDKPDNSDSNVSGCSCNQYCLLVCHSDNLHCELFAELLMSCNHSLFYPFSESHMFDNASRIERLWS